MSPMEALEWIGLGFVLVLAVSLAIVIVGAAIGSLPSRQSQKAGDGATQTQIGHPRTTNREKP